MYFYELTYDDSYKKVRYTDDMDWETIVCAKNPGHQRAGKRIDNLKVELKSKKIGDFMWSIYGDCLVSDEVVNLLHKKNLKGFKILPVEIVNAELSNRYWEFIVTGKGGHVTKESNIRIMKKCDYCGLLRYSVYENGFSVNKDEWDKSDFFSVIEYSGMRIVPDYVKEIIEQSKLTNIKFVKTEDLRWPENVAKPY